MGQYNLTASTPEATFNRSFDDRREAIESALILIKRGWNKVEVTDQEEDGDTHDHLVLEYRCAVVGFAARY